MIRVDEKKACTGCTACLSVCPQSCIEMKPDKEGFMYPNVSLEACIDCGLCEKICPMKKNGYEPQVKMSIAAVSENINVRRISSSGGVFNALAEYVISKGGIVYGATFDEEWNVIHRYSDTIDGLKAFSGSKYVQSSLKGIYKHVLEELKRNRLVLFSGTPCQIAGLNGFLRKDYDNLISVEVSCHGVPSPKIWHSYLDWMIPHNSRLREFSFRDKKNGWRNYNITYRTQSITKEEKYKLHSEEHSKNIFFNLFLSNLILRPSCYSCHFKNGKSGADMNIGDCWGLSNNSSLDDDLGVSSIVAYSEKAVRVIKELSIKFEGIEYERLVRYNPSLVSSVVEPNNREQFWNDFYVKGFGGIIKYYKRMDSLKNLAIKRIIKIKKYLIKK